MTFDELVAVVSSGRPPRVRGDSRLVEPGDVFAAICGSVNDGHDFIEQAVAGGARYIIRQAGRPGPVRDVSGCKIITVQDSSKAAAVLAQAGRGYPSAKLTNLAVTGTNGKTTVVFLVRSIIETANRKCGLLGTIFYDTGGQISQAQLTTPDCFDIAEKQQQMVDNGCEYMVMEASSHSLVQNRLEGIDFKVAAFTNLSRDHLDYHGTSRAYLAAKTKLFSSLSSKATAVLNRDSPAAEKIAGKTKAELLWYSMEKPADLTAHVESMTAGGTVFTLQYGRQTEQVTTPLPGRYNISNHLAAAGIGLAAGFSLNETAAGLSALKTIPGRLERLDRNGVSVIIDFAHTKDALENVLSAVKPLCSGKLIVVFGCGGDRDPGKRGPMAKVAQKFADFVVVTSDNPRTEEPMKIIEQICAGFEKPDFEKIKVAPDRARAIAFAVAMATPGDTILIAGKGHETCQILGTEKIPFSDRKTVLEYLNKRKR